MTNKETYFNTHKLTAAERKDSGDARRKALNKIYLEQDFAKAHMAKDVEEEMRLDDF